MHFLPPPDDVEVTAVWVVDVEDVVDDVVVVGGVVVSVDVVVGGGVFAKKKNKMIEKTVLTKC